MAITFSCEHCEAQLTVKDELAGKTGKCPTCKGVIVVPASRPSADFDFTSTPRNVKKRRPAEDEEDAEDVEITEDEEDDEPPRKKGGKSRKAASYDEDEEDRPRKAKKKSSRRDDDEDEYEEDRPSKRKASAGRRRDEDEEEEREEDNPRAAKKRKARRRLAAVGVLLHSIGSFVYAGAFVFSAIAMLILAGSISSWLSLVEQEMKGKTPKYTEAEAKRMKEDMEAREKKSEQLLKWIRADREKQLEKKMRENPRANQELLSAQEHEEYKLLETGVQMWCLGSGGAVIAIGFLVGLGLLAGLILSSIGLGLTLRTPGGGAIVAFSIASLACTGLSLLFFLIIFIILLGGDGGLCALLPCSLLNPLSGAIRSAWMTGLATWIVAKIGFLMYLIPLLELGRLTTFALYQWFIGKSQRDRRARFNGFLMLILIPSVIAGIAFLVFAVGQAMPTPKDMEAKKEITKPWGAAIVFVMAALAVAGLFLWHAFSQFSTRRSLKYGD